MFMLDAVTVKVKDFHLKAAVAKIPILLSESLG